MSNQIHPKVRIDANGYGSQAWQIDFATSPVPVQLSDLFTPSFWYLRAGKFQELDTVRCIAADRSWIVTLVVISKAPAGLVMDLEQRPTPGSPEWQELMRGIVSTQAALQAEVDAEVAAAPIAPPATGKKAKVPA
jgi:hypothetical protein